MDLGPPVLLDGYSAGWRITRTGSYVISVQYGPQRIYTIALCLSGAFVLVVLTIIGAGAAARRRRRRPTGGIRP